jgi:hypothetical protein
MFSNVQILVLKDSSTLVDLQPLQNIRYLRLESLRYMKNFSCLGKHQKYIKISSCPGLTDEAVNNHYGNVYHLCITNCRIRIIKGLTHNRFINLDSNDQLIEIDLPGKDYIRVTARYCFNLTRIQLTGIVYSLEVSDRGRIMMGSLKRNCNYLNGKDTQQGEISGSSGGLTCSVL